MKSVALCALLLSACARNPGRPTQQAAAAATPPGIQTIESVDPRPKIIDPPPMLSDEAPPPKPKGMPWEPPQPVILTPEDEKVRASLPFSPAIAMDPIDGGKISIRANTPTFEYKGRIYYFSNEANKRTFAANPEAILKGGMMRL